MKKFEYYFCSYPMSMTVPEIVGSLNLTGSSCWEVVSFIQLGLDLCFLFKREIL